MRRLPQGAWVISLVAGFVFLLAMVLANGCRVHKSFGESKPYIDNLARTIYCQKHHRMETQRRDCEFNCKKCKEADLCCCKTVRECTCVDPTNSEMACCQKVKP